MIIHSTLESWHMQNQRILVRADLNIPLNKDGTIGNDYRLKAVQPTLDYILQQGGLITLMTHIGRPEKNTPELSTQHLMPWFEQQGYSITWVPNIEIAYKKSLEKKYNIILLENLRFFSGETTGDTDFAQQLAHCGDYYVNDAFGTLHRHDGSITLVPTFFSSDRRSIGFLIENECIMLNKLLIEPKKPFVLITGGGKIADKIPLLQNLLKNVTDIMLCPATVFTFLAAQGKSIGKSLIDTSCFNVCNELIANAQKYNVMIHFPVDYQIAYNKLEGELEIVDSNAIPKNGIGISIGPKSIDLFAPLIKNAETIFFNAAMGFASREQTLKGTKELLALVAQSDGFSVIGGGDSVAIAQQMQLDNQIDYLSTGGGATLTYLSNQKLPGLEVFKSHNIAKK